MKFEKWIKEKTPRQVARALDIDQSTVWHWTKKRTCPKVSTMREIVKVSEGRVSYEDMIEYFLSKSKNK
jgi:hypothetical protein